MSIKTNATICAVAVFILIAGFANGNSQSKNAIEDLIKSAEKGDSNSQVALAMAYYRGNGIPQDYAEAVKWYRKAANKNNVIAQFNLGLMYSEGMGIGQDFAEASKWYRKAAEQGNVFAQINLAAMYADGKGIAPDYAEAMKWYFMAANQNNAIAQFNLGLMYYRGRGIAQDLIGAHMWWNLSAAGSQGEEKRAAERLRDAIAKQKTPRQIEDAQRLATEWKTSKMSGAINVPGYVQESRLIKRIDPVYPELAKRTRVTGTVKLIVTIDEEGNISDIRISSGHPLLNEAAINAVKQWKYSPTLLNGVPVPVTATATVNFSLKYKY